MTTISVCVSTYGDNRWRELALARAAPSVTDADELIVHHEPEGTVASCRNNAASEATGDLLVFLDGDDELAAGYVRAMKRDAEAGCLLTPRVSYVRAGTKSPPRFWPECDFSVGNWIVIGTAIERDLFNKIGGFADEERYGGYEDYHMWAKCSIAGARVKKIERAVYIAHQERSSRHRYADMQTRLRWHYEIGKDLYPHIYNERWARKHGLRLHG